MITPRLVRIDLSKTTEDEDNATIHPDIKLNSTKYLAHKDGFWYVGLFSMAWHGFVMHAGMLNIQLSYGSQLGMDDLWEIVESVN